MQDQTDIHLGVHDTSLLPGTLPVICPSELGSHGRALLMTCTMRAHPGSWSFLTLVGVSCRVVVV